MRHYVITRQRYDDDKQFLERMALARATVIPAMVSQSLAKKITWHWIAHSRHFVAIATTLENAGWKGGISVSERTDSNGIAHIHTTLDSDDTITPDFLEIVQSYWEPGDPFLVTWIPIKRNMESGEFFYTYKEYSESKPSMFYSVYNPTKSVYAYVETHTQMHKACPAWLAPERLRCILNVHGKNKLNMITEKDKPLPPEAVQLLNDLLRR